MIPQFGMYDGSSPRERGKLAGALGWVDESGSSPRERGKLMCWRMATVSKRLIPA